MNFALVIPARYRSSRFPGKPLTPIAGKSLISRVWSRCVQAVPKTQVYVATDDERISRHCEELGIQVVMTSEDCLTGTDRTYDASQKIEADVLINVQGDEPLIAPEDIQTVINRAQDLPGQVVTAMCKISSEEEFRSPSVPKVITRPDGRLLYVSRGGIPTTKHLSFQDAFKQVCVYALPRDTLRAFYQQKEKTPLESIEDIEILRFLELGYDVHVVEVSQSSIAVDFPEDVLKVERALEQLD